MTSETKVKKTVNIFISKLIILDSKMSTFLRISVMSRERVSNLDVKALRLEIRFLRQTNISITYLVKNELYC